jgi:hypothetical protein
VKTLSKTQKRLRGANPQTLKTAAAQKIMAHPKKPKPGPAAPPPPEAVAIQTATPIINLTMHEGTRKNPEACVRCLDQPATHVLTLTSRFILPGESSIKSDTVHLCARCAEEAKDFMFKLTKHPDFPRPSKSVPSVAKKPAFR